MILLCRPWPAGWAPTLRTSEIEENDWPRRKQLKGGGEGYIVYKKTMSYNSHLQSALNFHVCNQGKQNVTMATTSISHKVSQTLLFLVPIDSENKIEGGQMCSLNPPTGSD